MLRNSFLSLSARHYAFLRWLTARQPVTLSGMPVSDRIPFIPPMMGGQEPYDLPLPVPDLAPNYVTDALSPAVSGAVEDAAAVDVGVADFAALDDPSSALDRVTTDAVPTADLSVPTSPPSTGQARHETPPIAPSPPMRSDDVRPLVAIPPGAMRDVASPPMQANDLRGVAPDAPRASDRARVGEPTRAPDPPAYPERPVAVSAAPVQPQTPPEMPDGSHAGEVAGHPVFDDVRDSVDRDDTPQRPEQTVPVLFPEATIIGPHAAETARAEPESDSDTDPSLPTHPDMVTDEHPRDQPRVTDRQRAGIEHDDATARHSPEVGLTARTTPQAQTPSAVRANPGPGASATPTPPPTRTRWQRTRHVIQQRLTRRAPLPRPNVQTATTIDATASRQDDTAPRASGTVSDRPAVAQALAAPSGEAPRSAPPGEIPPTGDAPTSPAFVHEALPRDARDSTDALRPSAPAADAVPAQRTDAPPVSVAPDAPLVWPATTERGTVNDAQTREGTAAEPAARPDTRPPFPMTKSGNDAVASGTDAALVISTSEEANPAAPETRISRHETVSAVEATADARDERSRDAAPLASAQAMERVTESNVESLSQHGQLLARQTEDQPQSPVVRQPEQRQPLSGQPLAAPDVQSDQSLSVPGDVRDAGSVAPPSPGERQELGPSVADPLPVQPPSGTTIASPPAALPPVPQTDVQRVAPTQRASNRPFIAPSQPVHPRAAIGLPRAARTLAAWLTPRQTREQTSPSAEQPTLRPPPVQPGDRVAPPSPSDPIADPPQDVAVMAADAPTTPRMDAADRPSAPPALRPVSESGVADRSPAVEAPSAVPPQVPETVLAPFVVASPAAPVTASTPPEVREQRVQAPDHGEITTDEQTDESSAIPPQTQTGESAAAPAMTESASPERLPRPHPVTSIDAVQGAPSTPPSAAPPAISESARIQQSSANTPVSPDLRDARPEDQETRSPEESARVASLGPHSPVDEPAPATPIDMPSAPAVPIDAPMVRQTSSLVVPLDAIAQPAQSDVRDEAENVRSVADAIADEQPSQGQSSLDAHGFTMPPTGPSVNRQSAPPSQRQPIAAMPERMDHPVIAISPEMEPTAGMAAEGRSVSPIETETPIAPIAQPPDATVPAVVSSVETHPEVEQPADGSREADRSERIPSGEAPDAPRPAVGQPAVAPPASASLALTQPPAPQETAIERGPVNDLLSHDRAEAAQPLAAEAPKNQPWQPTHALPPATDEPQTATEDGPNRIAIAPETVAVPDAGGHPDAPIETAIQPESAPPRQAALDSRASSPGAIPQLTEDHPTPDQSSTSTPHLDARPPTDAPLPAIAPPAQRTTITGAETGSLANVQPATEAGTAVPNQPSNATTAASPDFHPASVATSASEVSVADSQPQPQPQPDLMQVARAIQEAHMPSAPVEKAPDDLSAVPGPNNVDNRDTVPPLSASAAMPQPEAAISAAVPADPAAQAPVPLSDVPVMQAVEATPTVISHAPSALPHLPTHALDPSAEPPPAALTSTPTAQPPEPVSPTVTQKTPGDLFADNSEELTFPDPIEVRQARRRPILPPPAPSAEPPPPSEADIERERAERVRRLDQAAR